VCIVYSSFASSLDVDVLAPFKLDLMALYKDLFIIISFGILRYSFLGLSAEVQSRLDLRPQ